MKARKYQMGGPVDPKKKEKELEKKQVSAYEAQRAEKKDVAIQKADAYKRQLVINRAAGAAASGDAGRAQRIASNFQGASQNGISTAEVSTGVRTPEAAAKSVETRLKSKK